MFALKLLIKKVLTKLTHDVDIYRPTQEHLESGAQTSADAEI